MTNKIDSKLLLVDKSESLYIFRKGELEPFKLDKTDLFKQDFEFIISSKS